MTSLLDAILARRPGAAARATLLTLAGAATLGLLAVAAVERSRADALDARAARLEGEGGGALSALAAERAAAAFRRPTLAATLSRLAADLPAGVALVTAEQGEAGPPRVTLDTDAPELLRARLRAAGWRERAEAQGDGGRFRVTVGRGG